MLPEHHIMTAIPGRPSSDSSLMQLAQVRIDISPPCAELAMRVEAAGNQRCHISMPATAMLSDGETAAVHSSTLAILVDTAAGVLAGLQIGSNATLDLRVDHIQPTPVGCLLLAEAEIAALNRQWVMIRARVLGGDRVIAESVGTFIKRLGRQADALSHPGAEKAAALPAPAHRAARDFISWLGISATDGTGQIYMLPFSSRVVGHPGLQQAHGGIIGAFLEAAALMYLRWLGHDARTIDVTTSYHHYSGPAPLYARVHPVRIGSRVAALRVDAWQQGITQSTAQLVGNFLVAADDPL